MIEVEVENFQSIEKASFKIEGFTALVGRSNIGKSAIARAVKYALTGELGSDFVRHGPLCERQLKNTKKCRCQTTVRIKTEGVQVTWQKGDEVNTYQVTREGTAQDYSALDRGEPEFLKPEFQQVKIGDSRDLLQVADQFEHIFLLNKTGNVVADVLSDVAKLDDINEATRLVNKDRKEDVSIRNLREKDILELRTLVGSFEGLDDVLKRAEAVEAKYESMGELRRSSIQIQRFLEALRAMKVSMGALSGAMKPQLPDWGPIEAVRVKYLDLSRFCNEVAEKGPIVRRLSGVDKVCLPDVSSVGPALAQLVKLEDWVRRAGPLKIAIDGAEPLESLLIPDVDAPSVLLAQLGPMTSWVSRLETLKTALGKYQGVDRVKEPKEPSVEKLQDLTQLQHLLARQDRLTQEVQVLVKALLEAEGVEKAVADEFSALGVCPTCTQSITPDPSQQKAG